MPLSEMDISMLSSTLVLENPIFGTLCLVLICPVVVCCMYYLTAFVPVCNKNPWLGYLAVTLLTAFPGFCNFITGWDLQTEAVLYLVRLPIHLLACWSLRKTQTIFVPMIIHAANNLVSCGFYLYILYVLIPKL